MYTHAVFYVLTACSPAIAADAAVLGRDISIRTVALREILGLKVRQLYE